MVKLVNTIGLEPIEEILEGSNPSSHTIFFLTNSFLCVINKLTMRDTSLFFNKKERIVKCLLIILTMLDVGMF